MNAEQEMLILRNQLVILHSILAGLKLPREEANNVRDQITDTSARLSVLELHQERKKQAAPSFAR